VSEHIRDNWDFPVIFGQHTSPTTGGDMLWDEIPTIHMWNELPNGDWLDGTADQFGHPGNVGPGIRVMRSHEDPNYWIIPEREFWDIYNRSLGL
jgi:hypothetical protein